MTWPEVLRWLALILTPLAALVGVAWTLGRIFRPWVADVARTEADRIGAKVDALADKLATNDFPHLEERIERRAAEDRAAMRAHLSAMEERIGARLDRMENRLAARSEDPDASPDPEPEGGGSR